MSKDSKAIPRWKPNNNLEKLPALPLKSICRYLPLTDILDLSLSTPNMKREFKEVDIKIDRFEVAFDPEESYISIRSRYKSLKWGFTVPNGLTPDTYRQIGRFKYLCAKTQHGEIFTNHYDIEHGIPTVLSHFVNIFNFTECNIGLLSIDLSVIADFRSVCEMFKHFNKIDKLVLKSAGRDEFDFTLGENMKMLLNKWNPDEAYIGVNPDAASQSGLFGTVKPPMYRFEKLLTMNHVHLAFAEWITPSDFLAIDCKTMIIESCHNITNADINSFIKQWLASGSAKLMWIEVMGGFNSTEVCDGLEAAPSRYADRTVICQHHCNVKGEVSTIAIGTTSQEVVRASDQAVGTIITTESSCMFYVKGGRMSTPPPPPQPPREEPDAVDEAVLLAAREEMRRRRAILAERRRHLREHMLRREHELAAARAEMEHVVDLQERQRHAEMVRELAEEHDALEIRDRAAEAHMFELEIRVRELERVPALVNRAAAVPVPVAEVPEAHPEGEEDPLLH